ncbi:MAG: TerB family tellurite resistance protein [Leptolyngbya sp. SIO4C1]|nr:TerB family tellurite resistance protein [Leptolyngbya sp. SIO4C1]
MQPPPPPSISPRQMNLLRIVLALAWADGTLAKEEVDVMLSRFSRLFAATAERQQYLEQELRSYLVQDIPLGELVPKLETVAEKEFVLRLSYEVISASARTPDEAPINQEESRVYQQLVQLLDLPTETVKRVESEAQAALDAKGQNVIDLLVYQLRDYLGS